MSVAIDVAITGGRLGIPKSLVVRAAELTLRSATVRHAAVSITFVGNRRIAALNLRHLGHRGPTDVISFGYPPAADGAPLVGDIYIATEVARRSARERGIPLREELVRLVVHGTLHVAGWDHPDDESRTGSDMWRRQERLVRRALGARGR